MRHGGEAERGRTRVVLAAWSAVFLLLTVVGSVRTADARRYGEQLRAAERRIARYDGPEFSPAAVQARVEGLLRELRRERARYYRSGEVENAAFGLAVKEALASRGLDTETFQVIQREGAPLVEISVGGGIRALADFFGAAGSAPRHLSVPYLTVNAAGGDGRVRSAFRIALRTLPDGEAEDRGAGSAATGDMAPPIFHDPGSRAQEEGEQVEDHASKRAEALAGIASLFTWRTPAGRLPGTREPGPGPEIVEPVWLIYVGDYTEAGRTYLLLRDTRTNRVYTVPTQGIGESGWRVVEAGEEGFLLEKDGVRYRVGR